MLWAVAADGVVSSHDQIILALIALVSMSIAALVYIIRNGRYIKTAAEEATAANAATNGIGPGEHRLYDMVRDTRAEVKQIKTDVTGLKKDQAQFDSHGWETLPADIGTAVGLTTTIRDLQNNHKIQNEKLDTIISELREHVQWEMDVKYGRHGST